MLLILIVGCYPCAGFHAHARWDRVSWVPFQGVWHAVNLSPDALKNAALTPQGSDKDHPIHD
jgi:hypothetical protein